MKHFFLTLLAASSLINLQAEVRLPHILSDGMVVQRNDSIVLWGNAAPQEIVPVKLQRKSYKTQADAQGNWRIALPPHKAGGPYTLTIGEHTLNDVYVGDVWVTSGQSNVDLMISRVEDLYKAETDAYSNPKIHLIQIATRHIPEGPQEDLSGTEKWEALKPENTGHWSAISYFFAREMYEKTGVPQGIINASQGGSVIEAWISRKALQEKFPKDIEELDFCLTDGYMERCNALNAAIQKQYSKSQDEQDPGLKESWMRPETDDSDWETIHPYDYNIGQTHGKAWRGTLWFRKKFEVPETAAGKEALLRLGCLIDADEAFINGEKVGVTYYQYPPRKYRVRAGLLKAGENTLCIRLKTGGNPTKFVKDKPYKIIIGEEEISLEGTYKMKRGTMMPAQPGVRGFADLATGYYNGMIAPLKNCKIAGMVWYQGESNTGNPKKYLPLLETLAADWRSMWGEKPLIIVQLANYMQQHQQPVESNWAALREAQRKASLSIPNAALATAIGLGEWNDIHPLNKKDLAHRVALQAQKLYLNEHKTPSEGPAYESCSIEGDKVIISFRKGTDQLAPSQALKGFSIAGADGKFVWAEAYTEGNRVIVSSPKVKDPRTVRYAWDDNPILSLYGVNGLPAAPFSTAP